MIASCHHQFVMLKQDTAERCGDELHVSGRARCQRCQAERTVKVALSAAAIAKCVAELKQAQEVAK